ncbi:MAG: CRISPR system precrRNA processing endoribonuclease RAMP protein Cas6 [bacterium]
MTTVNHKLHEAIQALPFCRLKVTLHFREPGLLPLYKGSMLRGNFGRAFKQAVCVDRARQCSECVSVAACAYLYVFETPVPKHAARMKKYPTAPHPFIITPLDGGHRHFEQGGELEFELTLFGERALSCLPYMIRAFEMAGDNGYGSARIPAIVKNVCVVSRTGRGQTVYAQDRGMIRNPEQSFFIAPQVAPENGNSISLNFITPGRLQKEGKILSSFDFRTFVSALLRRFTNMAYFHAGIEVDMDFKEFLQNAEGVKTDCSGLRRFKWGRYSNRQKQSMDMDGMTGGIVLGKVPPEFMTLIGFGEIMHVGKNATFGCGGYALYGIKALP